MQKKERMPPVPKACFFFAKAADSLIKTFDMPKVSICCIYIFMSKRQINAASVENVWYLTVLEIINHVYVNIINKCCT